MNTFFIRAARIFTGAALLSFLLVTRGLYFPFITGKVLYFRSMVEIALFCLLSYLIYNPGYWTVIKERLRHPVSIAVLAYAFFYVLTSLTGINPGFSFWSNFERAEGGFQIIHYVTFYVLLISTYTTKQHWKWLISFLLIETLYVMLYATAQAFGIAPSFFIGSASQVAGTLGNASYLGGYMIFIFFYLYWMSQNTKSVKTWTMLAWYTLWAIFVFYRSKTTAALGAVGIGGVVGLLLLIPHLHLYYFEKLNKKAKTFFYAFLVLLISFITFGSLFLVSAEKGGNILEAFNTRFWTWGSAYQGFLERPLLGYGAESFPSVFDMYYNPNHFGRESWFDRAHNIFIDELMNGGILLLLAYIGIFIAYYMSLKKIPSGIWRIIFLIMPLMFIIQGLTIFAILPTYLMLFLFLAFYTANTAGFLEETALSKLMTQRKQLTFTRAGGQAVIVLLLLTGFGLTYTIYRKNVLLITSAVYNAKNLDQALNDYEKALQYKSVVGQSELESSLFLFLQNAIQMAQKENPALPRDPNFMNRVLGMADKWYEPTIYPGIKNHYIYNLLYMAAFEATKNPQYSEKAKALAKTGEDYSPTRIEFIQIQARIAMEEGDQKELGRLRSKLQLLRPDLSI